MKILPLFFCMAIMLSLLGCTQKSPTPVPETTAPQTAITATEAIAETAPTEKEVPDPTEPKAEIPKNPIIETKYYTLSLPDHWKETCFYTVVDDATVTLRETDSYEAFGGGKLCTLMLMPTSDDTYKDFPDYELLCALDTPEGSFYVVALFPTDVQCNEDTAETYHAMAEELMDVLYSIKPIGDIEMAMP